MNITIHTFVLFRIDPHIFIIRLGKTTKNVSHDHLWLCTFNTFVRCLGPSMVILFSFHQWEESLIDCMTIANSMLGDVFEHVFVVWWLSCTLWCGGSWACQLCGLPLCYAWEWVGLEPMLRWELFMLWLSMVASRSTSICCILEYMIFKSESIVSISCTVDYVWHPFLGCEVHNSISCWTTLSSCIVFW